MAVRMRPAGLRNPCCCFTGSGPPASFSCPPWPARPWRVGRSSFPTCPGHGDSEEPAASPCDGRPGGPPDGAAGLAGRAAGPPGGPQHGRHDRPAHGRADHGRFTGLLFAEGNLRPEDATLSRKLAAMGGGGRPGRAAAAGRELPERLDGREDDLLYAATLSRCSPDVLWRYAAELVRTSDTPGLLEPVPEPAGPPDLRVRRAHPRPGAADRRAASARGAGPGWCPAPATA